MLPPELTQLRGDVEYLVLDNLRLLLHRQERAAGYGFVDMKLKVLTGEPFPPDAPGQRTIYSRDVIYGVIQSRAIEALARHARWLRTIAGVPEAIRPVLVAECHTVLRTVLGRMEQLRAAVGGRVCFMMSAPQQCPLRVTERGVEAWSLPPGGHTHTEVFYAKGLAAGATELGDTALLAEADAMFRSVVKAVLCDEMTNDRQPMDPKNDVRDVPGRSSHALKMLSLGGLAMGIDGRRGDWYWHNAARLIRDVMAGHVNRGQWDHLARLDFTEFVDAAGRPWSDEQGRIWCDPGHAIEYIGLASRALLAMRDQQDDDHAGVMIPLRELAVEVFPAMLTHLFRLTFNSRQGGMCKAYDLARRQPINSDMPWWNLPETIRAAAMVIELCPDADPAPLTDAALRCYDAYRHHYVRPELNHLPLQTRSADGQAIDVIPLVPDADPLYHTGLSLIDVLERMG